MHLAIFITLASSLTSYVLATDSNHTICYDYFLQKDGCVWASVDHPCPVNNTVGKPCTGIRSFHYAPTPVVSNNQSEHDIVQDDSYGSPDDQSSNRLVRRYDTTIPTLAVAGGDGICGTYNSTEVSGVCLWSGQSWVDGSDPADAGWLNGAETRNCNKQVYIQRQGQPETVQYANVLDGCSYLTTDPAVGCFQIWLTIDLFKKFGPTEDELSSFTINSTFSWDFNNENGLQPGNSPV